VEIDKLTLQSRLDAIGGRLSNAEAS